MKKCEKYNMKKAFEEKHDWDFTISFVSSSVFAGRRVTVLHPVSTSLSLVSLLLKLVKYLSLLVFFLNIFVQLL